MTDLGDDLSGQIQALRTQGLSYRQIAARLDVSIGTVSGRMSRALKAAAGKPNRGIARKPRGGWADSMTRPVIVRTRTEPPAGGIDMEQLTSSTCRWPITDDSPFKFCGDVPVEGRQYCERHEIISHKGSGSVAA